jgi:hypothetical protein
VPIEAVRNDDLFPVDVYFVHVTAEEINVPNHFANRINDVRQIQIARRDLVQHWREQEKVLPIHDGDFESRIPALLKLQRRIKSAKSTTENENTGSLAHRNFL